jgi:hypothetical protein
MAVVKRGLLEASILIVIAAALAFMAALVWVALAGGDYSQRLGVSLVVSGAVAAMTNDLTLTRFGMADTYAWFGRGPELDGGGGGQVLTGVGIFLFVSVPLIAIGVVLAS